MSSRVEMESSEWVEGMIGSVWLSFDLIKPYSILPDRLIGVHQTIMDLLLMFSCFRMC